jgi:hypothetical protein
MDVIAENTSREIKPMKGSPMTHTSLTIRRADASDAGALVRLAALDSAFPPTGDVLLAEVGDELWAAVELDTGTAIADPFRPSGDLVDLLKLRAAWMNGGAKAGRGPLGRLLPRAA